MVDYESDDDGRKASRVRAFLIRDWPYFAMLGLALFGVAYTSVARQAMTNYWIVLVPFFGVICVISRWRDVEGKAPHWHLIQTEALHWIAVIVAMYLVFVADVKQMMNSDASALVLLTLLALGRLRPASTLLPGVSVLSASCWPLPSPPSLGSKKRLCCSY
jgi:uncharacterized membrane protein